METSAIILILIYIVGIILAWQIFKKVGKVLLVLGILTFVLFLLIGGMAYRDFVDIKVNVQKGNVAVLVEDNKILAGFVMQDDVKVFGKEELATLQSLYNEKKYDEMREGRFKLLIIDIKALEAVHDDAMAELKISKQDAIGALRSNDAISYLAAKGTSDIEGASSEEVKAHLFAEMFLGGVLNEPVLLIEQMKEKNVKVEPDTVIFKAVRIIPTGLIESTIEKTVSKAVQAKDAAIDKVEGAIS